jgi:hypothetical protein
MLKCVKAEIFVLNRGCNKEGKIQKNNNQKINYVKLFSKSSKLFSNFAN